MFITSISLSRKAALAAIKTEAAAASSGEETGVTIAKIDPERVEKILAAVPEKVPVQKIKVELPETQAPVAPKTYFSAVYDVVAGEVGHENVLGCTLIRSSSSIIYPMGSKTPIVIKSYVEIYVLPPHREEPGRDFVLEISGAVQSMAREKFDIAPELPGEENLLIRKLQELCSELDRVLGMKKEKTGFSIFEKRVAVHESVAAMFERFTKDAAHYKHEKATLPEQLAELDARFAAVARREEAVKNPERTIRERVEAEVNARNSEAQKRYNEDWEKRLAASNRNWEKAVRTTADPGTAAEIIKKHGNGNEDHEQDRSR